MTLYFWLIFHNGPATTVLIRSHVRNRNRNAVRNAVRKTKTWNTHNLINFYSNWKNDPSKPKISASPVDWSGSEITKNTLFEPKNGFSGVTKFFDNVVHTETLSPSLWGEGQSLTSHWWGWWGTPYWNSWFWKFFPPISFPIWGEFFGNEKSKKWDPKVVGRP